MPKITAILHAHNDARRLGRALESLRPFDEVLVIDHASTDGTVEVARDHGATVREVAPESKPGEFEAAARNDWIFYLLPTESLSEALEASLFEWKERAEDPSNPAESAKAELSQTYSVEIRGETESGWQRLPAETRLVHRKRMNRGESFPPHDEASVLLRGDLLRFAKP